MPLHGLLWTEFRDHIVMEKLFSRNYQISAVEDQIVTTSGSGGRDLYSARFDKSPRGCHNEQDEDFG